MREFRLKICDLCGAPNLAENTECTVCGWRGYFSTDPSRVRSVIEIIRKLQRYSIAPAPISLRRLRSTFQELWASLQQWYRRRRGSHRHPFYGF